MSDPGLVMVSRAHTCDFLHTDIGKVTGMVKATAVGKVSTVITVTGHVRSWADIEQEHADTCDYLHTGIGKV